MKNKIVLLTIFFILLSGALLQVSGEEDFPQAQNAVKSGDKEFAFMHFRSFVKNNPKSKLHEEALFATTEYFFLISDYRDAFSAAKEFLEEYPDSKMRTFVLLYLLKISRTWQTDQLTADIEKQILNSKRIILLFKNTQEYKFRSPLGINYTLVYSIDRLDFYLDDKLQTQVYY